MVRPGAHFYYRTGSGRGLGGRHRATTRPRRCWLRGSPTIPLAEGAVGRDTRLDERKLDVAAVRSRAYRYASATAELVAVLPEWIRFLAEHTDMTAELTERCLSYASGERQFPGLLDDQGRPNPMARVTE